MFFFDYFLEESCNNSRGSIGSLVLVFLFIYLFIYLCLYLFIYLLIHLFIYLFITFYFSFSLLVLAWYVDTCKMSLNVHRRDVYNWRTVFTFWISLMQRVFFGSNSHTLNRFNINKLMSVKNMTPF